LWAYRYAQKDEAMQVSAPWAPVASSSVAGLRENNRWIDSTPILVEDRVLLTPRESDEMHCLDLATGNLIWKRKREDSLFVAAVHAGTVALVNPHAIEAVRIEDGKKAWDIDSVALPNGARPSGRGFMSRSQYFLPVDSAEVIAFDISTGKIRGKAVSRDGHVLGNLIAHRGTIISQSESQLIKYEQSDAFRERAQTLLAEDANNPHALRDLGEVALSEGDVPEAIRRLKRSYEIDARDSATRSMLALALLDGLEMDFSRYRQDLPLMRQLAESPSQKARLARLTAQGLQATGERLEAFESYLQLATIDMVNPQMQQMSRDWETRTSRWISAQLGELWRAASSDEKSQFVEILNKQFPLADAPAFEKYSRQIVQGLQANQPQPTIRLTYDEISRYLGYIGQLDVANALRLDLVEKRITSSPDLSVELALMVLQSQMPVDRHDRHDLQASVLAWHARLLRKFGRDRPAMILGQRLRGEFANATLPGGQKGRQSRVGRLPFLFGSVESVARRTRSLRS